ncbi:MAG: GNAT family N-acetyltransferase [bacterium]|nr:GNAT family N-acetyltransferase [bacterium]
MITIQRLTPETLSSHMPTLIALLIDAVDDGASVNFFAPFNPFDAEAYWRKTLASLRSGERLILAAFDGADLAGSVQLAFAAEPNGAHRADIQKLLVFTHHRRRGIAAQLMAAAEADALAHGRRLITLDTLTGSDAERLYEKCGYTRAGIIPGYALDTFTRAPQACSTFYKWLTPLEG